MVYPNGLLVSSILEIDEPRFCVIWAWMNQFWRAFDGFIIKKKQNKNKNKTTMYSEWQFSFKKWWEKSRIATVLQIFYFLNFKISSEPPAFKIPVIASDLDFLIEVNEHHK